MEGIYINLLSNNPKDLDIKNNVKDISLFQKKYIRSKILSYDTYEEKIIVNIKYGNTNTLYITDIGDIINGIITKIEISKSMIKYKNVNEIIYLINKYKNLEFQDQYKINRIINVIDRIKIIIENDDNILYKKLKYNIIKEYNKTSNKNIIIDYFINKNNTDVIKYTDVINDYYKYFNLIKEYIFNQIYIKDDIYDLTSELKFIYDIYNIPSNNIKLYQDVNKQDKYKKIFYINIKINKQLYDQKLIYIYNEYPENRFEKIKNIMIIENVINNTLQLSSYTSNYEIIINNTNKNYYCGSSFNNSLININKLYIVNSIVKYNNNYKINLNYVINHPFEINELLFIYDENEYIDIPDNMTISSIYNIYYKIPVAIGVIKNIFVLGNIMEIYVENIINEIDKINIGDYININKPNDIELMIDQIVDINYMYNYIDVYNQYNYILKQIENYNYTNDEIRKIILKYINNIFMSENNNIIIQNLSYDNLLNNIEHNILYLQKIYNYIHTQENIINNEINYDERVICYKSQYVINNNEYSYNSVNIINEEIKNKFLNKYIISGINNLNYYNYYQSYINEINNNLIDYLTSSYNNILKICRSNIIDNNKLALTFSNTIIDKYIYILNGNNHNLLIQDICIIYDDNHNNIYKDENDNIIKYKIINRIDNKITLEALSFISLDEMHNNMYLLKYVDNNVNSYVINNDNKIIKYVTMVDENGLDGINTDGVIINYETINIGNNGIFDFNDLLLHLIIKIMKNITVLDINILDYGISDISLIDNYFIIYVKNKLLELYHYIYKHNESIRNYYKNKDNTISGANDITRYNLIFYQDLNNIYCPDQIINYIYISIHDYINKYILKDIIQELIGKTVLIYNSKNNILEYKELIYDDIINENQINIKYLQELNEFNIIISYYYSYVKQMQNNLTNLNLLREMNLNFSYKQVLDINNQDILIYINLLKSIIDILKFKVITDENNNNIILSYEEIISNYIIINPDSLSDKKIFDYFKLYIKGLYENYDYYLILEILNNNSDKYYEYQQQLLYNYNIGITTGKITYIINSTLNINVNNIRNNENLSINRKILKKNKIDNDKLIYDKKIYNIIEINDLIDDIIIKINNINNKFITNINLLNINNVMIDTSINRLNILDFKNYILSKIFTNNNYNNKFKPFIQINNNTSYIAPNVLYDGIIEIFNNNISFDVITIYNNLKYFYDNNIQIYNQIYIFNNIVYNYYNIVEKYNVLLSELLMYNITCEYFYNVIKNNIIDELILELIIYIYNEFNDNLIYTKVNDIKQIIIRNKIIRYQLMMEKYIINIIKVKNNKFVNNIIKKIISDKNTIYLKSLIDYETYKKYKIYENTELYEKYLLYIPDVINNNKILLLPIIRDKYIICNNSYNESINNILLYSNGKYINKINNNTFYNNNERNKKIELYNSYILINDKIDDMNLYYNNISISEKQLLINLKNAENVLKKEILNKIVNNEVIILDEIKQINNLNYMIIDLILIDTRENINDNNKFKIINNKLTRINKIDNYEYDYNTKNIYYKKIYNENSQNMVDIMNNINNIMKNEINLQNIKIELLKIVNDDIIIDNIEFSDIISIYKNMTNFILENKNNYILMNEYNNKIKQIITIEDYIDYLINENGEDIYNIFNIKDDKYYNLITIEDVKKLIIKRLLTSRIENINIQENRVKNMNEIKKVIINRDRYPEIKYKWIYNLGYFIFDKIEFLIGDEVYNILSSDWIFIYNNIFINNQLKKSNDNMIGNVKEIIEYSNNKDKIILYIDIPLFIKNGYFPTIGVKNNNIRMNIKLKDLKDLYYVNNELEDHELIINDDIKINNIINIINYKEDEKKLLSMARYEFLIQEIQYKDYKLNNNKESIELKFKNCVKDILWTYQKNDIIINKQYYNYTDKKYNYIKSEDIEEILQDIYNIDINKYDRVIEIIIKLFNTKYILYKKYINEIKDVKNLITSEYKNIIQYIYDDIHNNIKYNIKNSKLKFLDVKRFDLDENKSNNITLSKYENNNIYGLNCYNFNLYPNITQPSGYINLSLIDNVYIDIELYNNINIDGILKIYGRSYNLIKIMGDQIGKFF